MEESEEGGHRGDGVIVVMDSEEKREDEMGDEDGCDVLSLDLLHEVFP